MPSLRPSHPFLALLLAAIAGGALAQGPMPTDQPRANPFGDPFGAVTADLPGCPVPAPPLYSADEVKKETHWRAERGTSCFRSGRCRLPNAYLYDKEIFPRALQFLKADERFAGSSVWLLVQRRWVFVQGCVASEKQGAEMEAALKLIDDVEAVVGQWKVGPGRPVPYDVSTGR